MTGTVSILNVGEGDTKLVFDRDNPGDTARAARIVKDMLRRGYTLMVDSGKKTENGKPVYQRVLEFREDTFEYIIADFDPQIATVADSQEAEPSHEPNKRRGRPGKRSLDAATTKAVAVPHRAGG